MPRMEEMKNRERKSNNRIKMSNLFRTEKNKGISK